MHSSFRLLKSSLFREGIEQKYLCELMGKSQHYITDRMTGRRGWAMEDIYFLMDLLQIPYEEMHRYFPKSDLKCSMTA